MKKIFATLILALTVQLAHAQYENTKIVLGQKAPDLAFLNPKGQKIELSKINKDRVILLDFWASWCGPCRRSNPSLVAAYKKYNEKKFKGAKKGFTVVSVSLDQKKDAWIAAIQKDGLLWDYHMSDLGGWGSKPAEIYGVQFVPQSFLLDASGKVLGKYQTVEQAYADIDKMVTN